MIELLRLLLRSKKVDIVDIELNRIRKAPPQEWYYSDESFFGQAEIYLDLASICGLKGKAIVDSCFDLACTRTTDPFFININQNKTQNWEDLRNLALSVKRSPRLIDMKLEPRHFAAILSGRKTYEGRAFDPFSEKKLPGYKSGRFLEV